jgi:hypothetical protein
VEKEKPVVGEDNTTPKKQRRRFLKVIKVNVEKL